MKYELSAKSRTTIVKEKLFYDVITFQSVSCTKLEKKVVYISQKKPNALKFPKMYNFCFGQKNRAEVKIRTFPAVLGVLVMSA